jgi:hypothetical protein
MTHIQWAPEKIWKLEQSVTRINSGVISVKKTYDDQITFVK